MEQKLTKEVRLGYFHGEWEGKSVDEIVAIIIALFVGHIMDNTNDRRLA